MCPSQRSFRENPESQQTIENLGLVLKQKSSFSSSMKIQAKKFSGKGMTIQRWFKNVEQSALTKRYIPHRQLISRTVGRKGCGF